MIGGPESTRPRQLRLQLGLRVVFWLVAVFAVWMTVGINRSENRRLAAKIEQLRPIARDLVVDDPTRIAVVKLDELWYDESRWDVYLPPGKYRVCLATREVDDKGFPEAFWRAPIEPGRHRLGLELKMLGSARRIEIIRDGASLLSIRETNDWAGSGWSSQGAFSTSEQRPADQRLELHRRRFSYSDGKGRNVRDFGPSNGILLWIQKTDGPEKAVSK